MEEDEASCGRGLAQSGAVPAGLAAVATGLAQNLEVHTRSLDLGDAAAMQERGVYERVAHSLRSAAADLQTAAAEMVSAGDLPMAVHDEAALATPDVLDAFERYVTAEDDLGRLLEAGRVDNQAMLEAMRAEIGEADTIGNSRTQN